jgi:hypothetical protein
VPGGCLSVISWPGTPSSYTGSTYIHRVVGVVLAFAFCPKGHAIYTVASSSGDEPDPRVASTTHTHTKTAGNCQDLQAGSHFSCLDPTEEVRPPPTEEVRPLPATHCPLAERAEAVAGNVEWEMTVRPQATNAAKSKGRGHLRSAPTTAAQPAGGSKRTPASGFQTHSPTPTGGTELTN